MGGAGKAPLREKASALCVYGRGGSSVSGSAVTRGGSAVIAARMGCASRGDRDTAEDHE